MLAQATSHVLLPIKEPHTIWPALQLAFQLGLESDARLSILHVVSTPEKVEPSQGLNAFECLHSTLHLTQNTANPIPTFSPRLEKQFHFIIEQIVRQVPPDWLGSLKVQAICRRGDVVREILEYSRTAEIDTIVLGAKPKAGWWKWKSGIGDLVLREAPCRVVQVHHPSADLQRSR